eukprot:s5564_g9.t1
MKQDLRRYDSSANSWDLVRDIVQSGPSARWSHVAAWDAKAQVFYIYAGYNGTLCGDLWRFLVTTTSTYYTLQDKFFNNLDLQLHHHKLQLHNLPDKYFTHTVVKYRHKHQLKQHQQQLHDIKLEHQKHQNI